jgi:hypothetical protein
MICSSANEQGSLKLSLSWLAAPMGKRTIFIAKVDVSSLADAALETFPTHRGKCVSQKISFLLSGGRAADTEVIEVIYISIIGRLAHNGV